MSVEENDQRSLTVRLHVIDSAEGSKDDWSDFELIISNNGTIAELKTILESQDLIPDDSAAFQIDFKLELTSDSLPETHVFTENFVHVFCTCRESTTTVQEQPTQSTNYLTNATPSAPVLDPEALFIQRPPRLYEFPSPQQPATTPPNPLTSSQLPFLLNSSNSQNFDLVRNLFADPNAFRQLMGSSFMRSILSSPDFITSIINTNPQMRELRERNLDFNRILNDSQLLRESMEAMQNPSLMQEMINNTDRALNNIDAAPGGFNALRNVYESIQEPIWHASPATAFGVTDSVKTYDLRTDDAPSSAPIPSPWSPQPKANPEHKFTSRVVASGVAQRHRDFYRCLYKKSQEQKETDQNMSFNNDSKCENFSNFNNNFVEEVTFHEENVPKNE